MTNVAKINRRYSNQPKNGWLWIHDHPPELVRRYFLICAICDKFFWHCMIYNNKPAAAGSYKCESSRACELIECLDELTSGEIEESGYLTDALWAQLEWPALNLLVQGAVWGHKNISEACLNLFSWSARSDQDKAALEDYVDDIVSKRSHIFNEGNYHDSMNWLDIYDMELNATYKRWLESKRSIYVWEIGRKLKCIRRYMAYPLEGQIRRQWSCEASYLGFSEQQSNSHWVLLRKYLTGKINYHKARVDLIESALNSRFIPHRMHLRIENLSYDFGCMALDFFEARIKLFDQDRPLQLELL